MNVQAISRVFFSWLLMLVVVASAQAQPKLEGKLTVATYNIENLFDVFDDPYTADEGTRVKPRAELEKVATLLRKIDADVVAFEEIENEQVLKAFVTEMLGDMGYKYVAAATSNDGRGIRTAVASRLPIESITSYRHLDLTLEGDERTWRFARDLMHVKLKVSDTQSLHTFVVHLKSKRDDGADKQGANWRLAEATMARKIIGDLVQKDPKAWIIMTGDFNDTPESTPIQKLLSGELLTDLHASLEGEAAITYLKKPYRSRIDYILTSPALTKRVIKGSPRVVNDDVEMIAGADHAPVVATFDVTGD